MQQHSPEENTICIDLLFALINEQNIQRQLLNIYYKVTLS